MFVRTEQLNISDHARVILLGIGTTLMILLSTMSYAQDEIASATGENSFYGTPDSISQDILFYSKKGEEIFTVELEYPTEDFTTVEIFDARGILAIHAEFMEKDSHIIDARGLDPGKYTVKIKSAGAELVQNIIIPRR